MLANSDFFDFSIPRDWKLLSMDQIKDSSKGAIAMGPFGSNIKAENFQDHGVPVIKGTNLNYWRFVDGEFSYLSPEKAEELKNSACQAGDIIITHRGTIGQVGLIPNGKYERYIVSQSGLKISLNRNMILPEYAVYYLLSRYGQHQIFAHEAQVGVPSISTPTQAVKSILIPLPPLPEQQAIAEVLSSLDDKIDLLHRNNKTLEEMAETLFRQWFVEGAKEEWEVVRLKDLGRIVCGKTPSTKNEDYFNGSIPFVKIPDMHGKVFILETSTTLTEKGAKSQLNKTIPQGAIMVSCIATVGLVSIASCDCQTNQQINSLIPENTNQRYFLFLLLRQFKEELKTLAGGGSVTDNLNTTDFGNITIALPPAEILNEFDKAVTPIFDKIQHNYSAIKSLSKSRDSLLPKLMSGQVRVKN